jgi:PAS domain S-box-containing protein
MPEPPRAQPSAGLDPASAHPGWSTMQLFDAIPSSLLRVDRSLNITAANKHFLEKSRRTAAETLGQPLTEVFPPVIVENIGLKDRVLDVLRNGWPVYRQRMTYRAPGIAFRTYYYSILPLSEAGQADEVMLFLEDITEHERLVKEIHRVERHLASVVESASDIVLSTDTDARIMTWNSAAETLSGLLAKQVQGLPLFELFDESEREEARAVLGWVAEGADAQTAEWHLMTQRGEDILVSWVLSPMKDGFANTIGVVAVGRDLTERRALERELRRSQKLAALGVMAGGIAHEIRNPLAVCASAAQFLQEDDIDMEFRRECAEKIQANIQKASNIIENMLRFARPTRSAAEAEMQDLDLLAVLRETVDLISNHAKLQKIDIDDELPGGRLRMQGVATMLQQVFTNLFLNAVKAMPDGGTLGISVECFPGMVRVHVADTGVGIPQDDLDKIFDPFDTGSRSWGTGLGLSICYSIVRRHGGSIGVKSRLGEGSVFSVTLPLGNAELDVSDDTGP